MSEPTPEMTAALRAEFPPSQVGKLPRVTCRDCSDSRTKVCDKHSKSKCSECGNWITGAHLHLDYVGHGAVTDRLLDVDPGWSWEPVAWAPEGGPLMERSRGGNPIAFWIRLTVGGVTRLGVGTCPDGQFEAEKVLIGDALRNAAMRFGVALDLWIKGHGEDDEARTAADERVGPSRQEPVPVEPLQTTIGYRISQMSAEAKAQVKAYVSAQGYPSKPAEWTDGQAMSIERYIDGMPAEAPQSPQDATEPAAGAEGAGVPSGAQEADPECASTAGDEPCDEPVAIFDDSGTPWCATHAPKGVQK